jgi:hypothetical protein
MIMVRQDVYQVTHSVGIVQCDAPDLTLNK